MEQGIGAWREFFVAEVGASAALAGLVIVAISINLGSILKFSQLPGRAAESLIYLGGALLSASFGLMPQGAMWFGAELAVVGAAMWLMTVVIQVRAVRHRGEHPHGPMLPRLVFGQMCTLPVIVAGGLIVGGQDAGLFVLAGGILVSLAMGLANTWVLLVEILR